MISINQPERKKGLNAAGFKLSGCQQNILLNISEPKI